MLADIKELDGEVTIYYDMCADGRKRVSSFNLRYSRNCVGMEGELTLSWVPKNRNNKIINGVVRPFLEDLRSLADFKDKHGIPRNNSWSPLVGKDENGKHVSWEPKQFGDSESICVKSEKVYSY